MLALIAAIAAVGLSIAASPAYAAPDGSTWTVRASAEDNQWHSIAYGNGIFVAVAGNGTHQVMTSPDGINWTARTGAETNTWESVAYGAGLFVAVSSDGVNRVMTSPDGITWTVHAASDSNEWREVAYGDSTFVAVSSNGTNRVMTSADGMSWTGHVAAVANSWQTVTYGGDRFVAASSTGTSDRAMYSTDKGLTWTAGRTQGLGNQWSSITYGNGIFMVVAQGGNATKRTMLSTDGGATWTTLGHVPANTVWHGVTYGNGQFVAVGSVGDTSRVITSPDGATWTSQPSNVTNSWQAIAYAQEKFVAVATTGTDDRVMMSNDALLNQVKNPVDNTTPTDTLQLVPRSGTTPEKYVIYNNTQARLDKSPDGKGGTPGTRWAIWGYMWADTTLTLANSNTIPISLATYQNAGSCTPLGMPAKDCPRALGVLAPGKSMPFRASYKVGSTWENTPIVTLTRPPG